MPEVRIGSIALQNTNASIKVLLADDSRIIRRGMRELLAADIEIEIVGEAADFAQTIRMTSELNPQVVILDLHMPDEERFSPQEVKLHLNHGTQVVAISLWNDEESKELAENFGAAVLLDKMGLASTLIPTIKQLNRERSGVAERLIA
jgi:two-component system invasion response regulator UvrY